MKSNNNGWLVKSLGEICEIIGGNPAPKGEDAFVEDGLPFVKMKDVGRYHLTSNLIDIENKVSPKTAEQNRLKLIKKGSILLPRSGSVALNHRVILGLDAYMVSHLCALEIKDTRAVYNKFLYYHLTTINFSNITKKTTGLDALTFEDLARVKIPLPPLPIQKQIAEILEKADQAKQKRKEANKLTDEFLQSVFIEMFGDPVKNPKGWEKVKAKELFEIKLGKMRSEKFITGKYLKPYLRNVNVQWGYIDLSDIKKMDFDPKEQKIYSLKKDDILVCEGGEVGRTAIWNGEIDDVYFQNALHRLRQRSNNIDSIYFLYYMFFASKYGLILRKTSTVTIAHFTAEKFNEFDVLLPPIILQQQFAEIVNKTEALKEKQKQSEQELENLFQSLMQRAFRGELIL